MATPPKVNRTPKLSDTAKNALRNQRRRLATEQAEVEARRAMEARSILNRVTKPLPICGPVTRPVPTTAMAFHKGVVPRTAAVLASEGLQVRVNVTLDPSVGKAAWTDFESINVWYPIDESTGVDVAEIAAILRGTVYHEGGHCRFTQRPDEMIAAYLSAVTSEAKRSAILAMKQDKKAQGLFHYAWNLAEDQRMEMLVVEDSPRKAAYFAPMVIDMVIDYRTNLGDTSKSEAQYKALMDFFVHQGVLTKEQVQPFDHAAARKQQVAAYPLIAWRRYLPRTLRITMRNAFIAEWGVAKTQRIERLILTYVKTNDPEVAVDALIELAPLLQEVMVPADDHQSMKDAYRDFRNKPKPEGAKMDDAEDEYGDGAEGDELDAEAARQAGVTESQPGAGGMPSDEDEEDEEGESSEGEPKPGKTGDMDDEGDDEGGGEGDDDGEGDDADGEGEGDDGEAEGNGDGGTCGDMGTPFDSSSQGTSDASHKNGSGAGTEAGNHSTMDEELSKAKAEAEAVRDADAGVKGDVQAFYDAMYNGDTGSQLMPYGASPSTDPGVIAEGQNMAREMVQAFQEVNTEAMPTWQEQQTRGVLNVGRYITRQPGDREFFRSWAEEEAPGRNLAVSVLLDYSGSMGGSTDKLSAVAYAMKAACDELELPCTVVLWDHSATLLWDGQDRADFVPAISAAGGTNPRMALEDLQYQRFDKDAHIVLVMTDGEFSSSSNWLNEYRTDGTYFLGVVYGGSARSEDVMAQMGFDQYARMTDLVPMVGLLESAIIDMADATK